jgi:hypothetical protein
MATDAGLNGQTIRIVARMTATSRIVVQELFSFNGEFGG